MADPFARLDRRMSELFGPAPRRSSRRTLSPAEEQSLIRSLGRYSLSGISAVGNLLDLPGSSVRDILSGENPLDQWLTPFRSDNRIRGRKMLERAGLLRRNRPGLDFGDVLGFGTEVLTDPFVWFTGPAGAATTAGKAVSRAGLMRFAVPAAQRAAGAGRRIGPRVARQLTKIDDILREAGRAGPEAASAARGALETAATAMGRRVEDLAGQPLGGAMSFGIPFGPRAVVGTGRAGQRAAGALDAAGHAIRYGQYSPIRPLAPLFDKRLMGTRAEAAQRGALEHAPREAARTSRAKEVVARSALEFERRGWFDVDAIARAGNLSLRDASEVARRRGQEVVDYLEGVTPAWTGEDWIRPHLDSMRTSLDDILAREEAAGLQSHELTDEFIKYFPRLRKYFAKSTGGQRRYGFRQYDTTHPFQIGREEALKNVRGGTGVLNDMSVDLRISGLAHKWKTGIVPKDEMAAVKAYIRDTYGARLTGSSQSMAPYGLARQIPREQLDGLAKWVVNLDPKHVETGLPAFELNPFIPYLARMEHGKRAISAAETIVDVLGKNARLTHDVPGREVSLLEVLRAAKIDTPQGQEALLRAVQQGGDDSVDAMQALLQAGPAAPAPGGVARPRGGIIRPAESPPYLRGQATTPAYLRDPLPQPPLVSRAPSRHPYLHGRAATPPHLRDPASAAVRQGPWVGKGRSPQSPYLQGGPPAAAGSLGRPADVTALLQELKVPQELADDAVRMVRSFTTPEEVAPFIRAYDQFTNLFKTSVTALWPAFHARNAVSAAFNNWVGGAFSTKAYREAFQILRRQTPESLTDIPMFRGLSGEQALRRLQELSFGHGVTGQFHGQHAETIGEAMISPLRGIPGSGPIFSGAPAGTTRLQRSLPWNMAGVAANADVWTGARVGRDVGHFVENMNRLSPFIALLRKGFSPAEAARRVKFLQVDYQSLTAMERSWARRIFVFWTFTSRMLPWTVQQLVHQPGGKLAQTLRALNIGRPQDTLVPEHVSQTASLPLGRLPDGTQRYIANLGLMFEDPMSLMGSPRQVGLELASRLHPLPKTVLEGVTGETFHQRGPMGGRELADLDPTVGRTIQNVRELFGAPPSKVRPKPFLGQTGELVLGNSPLTRFLSTARQLTSKHKWQPLPGPAPIPAIVPQLLTGMRITDVSPAAQDAIIQEAGAGLMKGMGASTFSKEWFRPEVKARMSPAELEQALLWEAYMALLAQRRKERAKASQ